MTLAAGTKMGPYEIVSPVGAGGMGEVFRARDTRLGRDVAIKLVHPRLAADAEQLRRFEQEARAASQLDHPNILVVNDVGGHLEEALAEAEKAVQLSGGASVAVALLACCCYATNDGRRADELRAQLEGRLRERHVAPSFFSWIAASGKRTEEAVRWLERAAEGEDPWFTFYRVVPPSLICTDPRIESLLSRFDL